MATRGGTRYTRSSIVYDFIDNLSDVDDEPGHANNHFLSKIPQAGKQANPTKRCRMCYANKKQKETVYVCKTFDGDPGLCAVPCFEAWHKII